MEKKMKVIRLVNKVEQVEIKTTDGQYSLTGQLTSDKDGALAFDGGGVIRQSEGAEVARIESWSRHGGLAVRVSPGQDLMEVSAVVKELTDVFTDSNNVAEEGGAA